MRTLLVLLITALISGCVTQPANSGSCDAKGMNYMPETDQCVPRANTNLGKAYGGSRRTHHIAEPIIDKGTATFDASQYASDLRACRQYANQVASQTLDNALGGLLLGAAMGAIIDGSYNTSSATKSGAMTGALAGGVHGSASTHQGRALVLRKCLAGRGYSVLDM